MMWSQELMVEEANGYRQSYDVIAVCQFVEDYCRVTFHFETGMTFPLNPVTAMREVNGHVVPFSRSSLSVDEEHVMAAIDVREGEYIEVHCSVGQWAILRLCNGRLLIRESCNMVVGGAVAC